MSKRSLFIIIIVLLITNIFTFIILKKNDDVVLENETKITRKGSVASINGEKIDYEDWIKELRQDYGEQHLRGLIDRSIVKQLSKERGIHIHEKLIDQGVASLTTMQGIIEEEEYGKLEEEWREDLLHQYQLEELLTEQEVVSEQDVEEHYDQYQKQYDFTASVQLSHIIVEDMDRAEKIIEELNEGASFHLLAKEYSIDEETKDDGGYLGYFTKGSQLLPTAYYEKTIDMEEYSYSNPIQTDRGVALLYLYRKLPEISFTYDEIKDAIRRELALNNSNQKLTAEPLWEIVDVDWIYEPK